MSMISTGGKHRGLIFQQPVHWNTMNVLRAIHKEPLIFTACSDLKQCETASSLSRIGGGRVKSSAKMRLKWQFEFTAAFIHCHHLLCSTWKCDEWHGRISQWSHFKSPLALRKDSAFSDAVFLVRDYIPGGGQARRRDDTNVCMTELSYSFLGGFGQVKILFIINDL